MRDSRSGWLPVARRKQLGAGIYGRGGVEQKIVRNCRRNFADGWEREGAAFSVYHKGELVIDLQVRLFAFDRIGSEFVLKPKKD